MVRLLILILAIIAAPAQAAWREAKSAHFVIYSEDKPDVLRKFATDLERFDAGMRVLRNMPQGEPDSPSNRLTIFLVSNAADVARLYGKGGSSIAGFYSGRVGGSYAIVPRRTGGDGDWFSSMVVLLHEYGHHFMFRNFPAAFPAWFTEGFAEFSSTARFVEDGSIDFGLPAKHRGYGLAMIDKLPIKTLLSGSFADLSPEQRAGAYGQSWLLIHYLTFSEERKGQLGAYLLAVNKGRPALEAAEAAFGDLRKLQSEVTRYLEVNKFRYLRVAAAALKVGEVEVRELSPGGSAIMPVRIRSHRGVDEKEAQEVLKLARKVAAPYPDDPFVQLVLAEAEIDAGNLAESDAAAARVLAAEPQSVRAMIFRGRVAQARLLQAKTSDPAAWKEARRWFIRANRAEPGAAEPPMHNYFSYIAEGVRPPDNAAQGLFSVALLAPEDQSLGVAVARRYLEDGKVAEARAALTPSAYDPHGGPRATFAAAVLAAIDAGGADAALAAWRGAEKPAANAQAEGDKGKAK